MVCGGRHIAEELREEHSSAGDGSSLSPSATPLLRRDPPSPTVIPHSSLFESVVPYITGAVRGGLWRGDAKVLALLLIFCGDDSIILSIE